MACSFKQIVLRNVREDNLGLASFQQPGATVGSLGMLKHTHTHNTHTHNTGYVCEKPLRDRKSTRLNSSHL